MTADKNKAEDTWHEGVDKKLTEIIIRQARFNGIGFGILAVSGILTAMAGLLWRGSEESIKKLNITTELHARELAAVKNDLKWVINYRKIVDVGPTVENGDEG